MSCRTVLFEPEASKENNRLIAEFGLLAHEIIQSVTYILSHSPQKGEELIDKKYLLENNITKNEYIINYRIIYLFNQSKVIVYHAKYTIKPISS
jgi:mRNA-degrading endonuclease RelE of RelBE toxin-antitoxin system